MLRACVGSLLVILVAAAPGCAKRQVLFKPERPADGDFEKAAVGTTRHLSFEQNLSFLEQLGKAPGGWRCRLDFYPQQALIGLMADPEPISGIVAALPTPTQETMQPGNAWIGIKGRRVIVAPAKAKFDSQRMN